VWSSETFTEDLAAVLDLADIIVGHNVDSFDLKKINAQLWLEGKPEPSPYKTVDTLKVLRSRMGLESNTLQSACDRAGIVTKVDKYDIEVARAAVAGDVKAQRRIKRYNCGDVAAGEALYERLLPWVKGHPHVNISAAELTCPRCGSKNLQRMPKDYLAVQIEYAAYRCSDCTGMLRAAHTRRIANTRPI
jgi:DNA-directed RNA polymerase subunit RPC12/RpoP